MDLTSVLQNREVIMVTRLIFAAILGGVVGIERGSGDRPAGFRTHILVCMGSALFMLVSLYGFDDFSSSAAGDIGQRRDSARIAAQVVSGIGFLGAGTILHEGLTIKGLTTAASLWMVSAIGLSVGSGQYLLSSVATIITMVTLVTFHTWEKRFAAGSRSDRKFIRIIVRDVPNVITDITDYLANNDVKVKSINVKNNKERSRIIVDLYIKVNKDVNAMEVIQGLQRVEGVESLENS